MKKEMYDEIITLASEDELAGILRVADFDTDIMPSEFSKFVARVDNIKEECYKRRMRGNRKMIRGQYHRILSNALSIAKRLDFIPDEFYYMLDGIMSCAQHDDSIILQDYIEISGHKDEIVEQIEK